MTAKSKTIVFFGSGPVAASSLELLSKDFEVEAVITKPRAPHHHGPVPVLELAEKLGLSTYTAENRASLDGIIATHPFNSQLAILIDFGIIVSQKVINTFPLGIINSHFSVLPEWRGADPITFAILSGQKQTGVSLMLLVEKMDEGPLVGYGEQTIYPDTTTPKLTEELIQLSYRLLVDMVPRYIGDHKTSPQSITGRTVSYSRKLTKDDGLIDWHKPAEQIEREIRAYKEWPKSRTKLADLEVVVTAAEVVSSEGTPGVLDITDKQLVVYCGKDALRIISLKPAGKTEMNATAFLAGYGNRL